MPNTRDVFHVRRVVDLINTAKVNAYSMYIFGKIELLAIHATEKYFKMHNFNDFQEAKTYPYIGHWKYVREVTFMDLVSERTLVNKMHENRYIAVHSFQKFGCR